MTAAEFRVAVENRLAELLSDDATGGSPLAPVMRYAALGGGKRVRPVGMFEGAESVGGDGASVLNLACALELIHSYSLVHDDLPAMDNDDYRRGKLTVHKKFGEANGILAGDALLSRAQTILARECAVGQAFAEAAAYIACCAEDMVVGQALDLSGMRSQEEFLHMYSLKTGALFRAAFAGGAIAAGGTPEQVSAAEKYASALGAAFQLADDLLDVGEDNSVTAVIGENATRALLECYTAEAVRRAAELPRGDRLAELAKGLQSRKN